MPRHLGKDEGSSMRGKVNGGAQIQQRNFSHSHYEKIVKENRSLMLKVAELQDENKQLKESVYDLSVRYDIARQEKGGKRHARVSGSGKGNNEQVYDLQAMLAQDSKDTAMLDNDLTEININLPVKRGLKSNNDKTSKDKMRDSRHFTFKCDLKGHTGAIYSIRYSPCGRYIATGSFDKSIKLWDNRNKKVEVSLSNQKAIVSDVQWSVDSAYIGAGYYAGFAKVIDASRATTVSKINVDGFAHTMCFSPVNNNIIFIGTSRRKLYIKDIRVPESSKKSRDGNIVAANEGVRLDKSVGTNGRDLSNGIKEHSLDDGEEKQHSSVNGLVIENPAMINSLYCYRDGSLVISGDSDGAIKTWDLRTGKCIDNVLNDSNKSAISCIHVPSQQSMNEEPSYLGVNSYDNVLRVYDRGAAPPTTSLNKFNSVNGHSNRNYPIKSSFYLGSNYEENKNGGSVSINDGEARFKNNRSIQDTMLLCTGSSDNSAYIYDVGNFGDCNNSNNNNVSTQDLANKANQDNFGIYCQKLSGHTDKVYAVDFHPSQFWLATASADSTVKLWYAKSSINNSWL